MGMQSQAGSEMISPAINDSSGPYYYDFADGNVTLRADQQVVFITQTSADAHKNIYLPPVMEADGKMYYFMKTDAAGSYDTLILPNGYVATYAPFGDSTNWDGSTGYVMDADLDYLLLMAVGGCWIPIANGIA